MSSTTDSTDAPDDTGEQGIDGFGYSIGLSFGIFTLIIIVSYVSYICTRMRVPAQTNPSSHITSLNTTAIEQGLNEATLLSYQKMLYSQLKLHNNNGDSAAASTGCSICLADYKDSDMLRLLPECGHLFHLTCVDLWLRMHSTCPICRNSPVPTPLTEVVT